MVLINATFTLPGLAGIVLTIGMAVDSNVLIYERMREEIARGSSLRMAIQAGFEKAFSSIFDSNVTTLLTTIVLFVIGTRITTIAQVADTSLAGHGLAGCIGPNVCSGYPSSLCVGVVSLLALG
ncbi:MAG: MMPL family transporter, partial [bacterium]